MTSERAAAGGAPERMMAGASARSLPLVCALKAASATMSFSLMPASSNALHDGLVLATSTLVNGVSPFSAARKSSVGRTGAPLTPACTEDVMTKT